jgi:hypothetical protein
MKLAIRPLIDCCGVNDFIPTIRVEGTAGDAFDFYFMLVDLEKNLEQHGWAPPGLRYIPGDGSLVTANIWNVDSAKRFARQATNPYPQDLSIWKIPLLSTDPLDSTVNMKIVLLDSVTTPPTQRTCYSQGALVFRNG